MKKFIFIIFIVFVVQSCADEPCSQRLLIYDVRLKVIAVDRMGMVGRVLEGPDTLHVLKINDENVYYNRKVGDTAYFEYLRKDRFSETQANYFFSTGHGCDIKIETEK